MYLNMIFLRIFVIVALACSVSAHLNGDEIKAIKHSWKEIKERPVEIAKEIYLRILDNLPASSSRYLQILVKPMKATLEELADKPVFEESVNKIVEDLDTFIFENLEESLGKLERMKATMRSFNLSTYMDEFQLAEASTLQVFSSFMKDNEIKAWEKLFRSCPVHRKIM